MQPVELPNGVKVWNCTPHPLVFWFEREKVEVEVPSHEVVSAMPVTELHCETDSATFNKVSYHSTYEGRCTIEKLRSIAPDALLIGSVLAAQGYPGEVVASVKTHSNRHDKSSKLVRPNVFTIFEKGSNNNGSKAQV
jgi:hypothetical protein